jgi:hypothetical protein
MGLLKQTQQQYYGIRKTFTGDGTTTRFTLATNYTAFQNFLPDDITVYINGDLLARETVDSNGVVTENWEFDWTNTTPKKWFIDFSVGTTPSDGDVINVEGDPDIWQDTGGIQREIISNYQLISIDDIISNFIIAYTGEGKLIKKIKRTDVQFHAMRALQELSYDTLKSIKSQEIEVPASLTMRLPQDYVNYVKLVWSDGSGIEHIVYPASKTSNPGAIKQDSNGEYSFDIDGDGTEDTEGLINPENSDTWSNYKSTTPSENNNNNYEDDTYWPMTGERYGLEPSHAQVNGSFFIDELKGMIHFSSNLSGETIILKYISDGLAQSLKSSAAGSLQQINLIHEEEGEPVVHKFAEEAVYKWIMHAILSASSYGQDLVPRLTKEKFAAVRKAKLRLSNIKLEEITQVLRGKSKWIKH